MTQQNILDAAKQGNPQAIAALMNRSLQPKGITAKVKVTDGCLYAFLEGEQEPPKEAVVDFVRKGVTGLNIPTLKNMAIYGRCTNDKEPAWAERINLTEPKAEPQTEQPAVLEPVISLQPQTVSAAKKKDFMPQTAAGWIGFSASGLIAWFVAATVWSMFQPSPQVAQMQESTREFQKSLDRLNQSSAAASGEITMSKYSQLETGMSYAQAEKILGTSGEEMSKNELAGMTTVMYMWKNPGGSNMNAMFQNDALVQKAQFGLK